jgi:hypothetical protein
MSYELPGFSKPGPKPQSSSSSSHLPAGRQALHTFQSFTPSFPPPANVADNVSNSLHVYYIFQSSPGIIRSMNSSNSGTVNVVSPWLGLQIIPLPISWLLVGPRDVTSRPSFSAISPDLCGPGPRSDIARRYLFSAGVSRSNLTRKKLSSNAAMAAFDAFSTSCCVIGDLTAVSHECLPHSCKK